METGLLTILLIVTLRTNLRYTTCLSLCFLYSLLLSTLGRGQGLTIKKTMVALGKEKWNNFFKASLKSNCRMDMAKNDGTYIVVMNSSSCCCTGSGNSWPILKLRNVIELNCFFIVIIITMILISAVLVLHCLGTYFSDYSKMLNGRYHGENGLERNEFLIFTQMWSFCTCFKLAHAAMLKGTKSILGWWRPMVAGGATLCVARRLCELILRMSLILPYQLEQEYPLGENQEWNTHPLTYPYSYKSDKSLMTFVSTFYIFTTRSDKWRRVRKTKHDYPWTPLVLFHA